MVACPHCRFEVESPATTCPRCRAPLPESPVGPEWVSIARLHNVAEAGYFADELAGEGIPCEVRQIHNFGNGHHLIETDYFLLVEQSLADGAAERLQELIAETANRVGAQGAAETGADPEDFAIRANLKWKMLVVLLAGMLTFGAIQYWHDMGRLNRAAQPSPALLRALRELSRPLEFPAQAGQPGFRLEFVAQQGRFLLAEDRDGDGLFELQREYTPDGVTLGE